MAVNWGLLLQAFVLYLDFSSLLVYDLICYYITHYCKQVMEIIKLKVDRE